MSEIENVYIRIILKPIKMFRILLALCFLNLSFAQQTDKVDFISCKALLFPDASNQSITGNVTNLFEIKNEIDTIKIDILCLWLWHDFCMISTKR